MSTICSFVQESFPTVPQATRPAAPTFHGVVVVDDDDNNAHVCPFLTCLCDFLLIQGLLVRGWLTIFLACIPHNLAVFLMHTQAVAASPAAPADSASTSTSPSSSSSASSSSTSSSSSSSSDAREYKYIPVKKVCFVSCVCNVKDVSHHRSPVAQILNQSKSPMLGLSSYKYDTTTVAALYEGAGSQLGRPLPCLRYIPAGAKKARIFVGKCSIVNGALVFECPALIEYCTALG